METRQLIAYALIALLAAAAGFGLFWLATRRARARRHEQQRIQDRRDRARTAGDAPLAGITP